MENIMTQQPQQKHVSDMAGKKFCKWPYPEGQRWKICNNEQSCEDCLQIYRENKRDENRP